MAADYGKGLCKQYELLLTQNEITEAQLKLLQNEEAAKHYATVKSYIEA